MQDKIIELETKFSFQEDLLTDLNAEVVRQQRQISEILRELALLKEQLADAVAREGKQPAVNDEPEKPPHY